MAKPISERFASKGKWGRLTPIEFVDFKTFPSGQRRARWRFKCDCGNEPIIDASAVASGNTKSCGCWATDVRAAAITHGAARTGAFAPTYRSWRNMLTRGRNPNINRAERYVLRGITVCDDWLPGVDGKGYERFLAYAGERPSPQHSIDRIDNDRGYEPGNVRWVVQSQQTRNQRRNKMVQYQGQLMTLVDAAEKSGIKYQVIRDRIRLGWPPEKWFLPRARAEFGLGKCSRPGVKPRSPAPADHVN